MKNSIDEIIEQLEVSKNILRVCAEEFYEDLEYYEYSIPV